MLGPALPAVALPSVSALGLFQPRPTQTLLVVVELPCMNEPLPDGEVEFGEVALHTARNAVRNDIPHGRVPAVDPVRSVFDDLGTFLSVHGLEAPEWWISPAVEARARRQSLELRVPEEELPVLEFAPFPIVAHHALDWIRFHSTDRTGTFALAPKNHRHQA